jgi:hypothetical protein
MKIRLGYIKKAGILRTICGMVIVRDNLQVQQVVYSSLVMIQ